MLDLDHTIWTRYRFDDIAVSVTDRVDDPSQAGVDHYVGLEHLDAGSMTVDRWGVPGDVSAQKLFFEAGDVIFGRRRAYQKKVARASFRGICSAHALVLRARPEVIDPDFLPVFLSSDYFLDRAIAISVGSLSPTVNWRDLARQEFDLPPVEDQRRIAGLVWALEGGLADATGLADALVSAREAWVEARFEGLWSAAPSTVGDLVRARRVALLTGPFGSSLSASEYVAGGVPVIHPSNIRAGEIAADRQTTVPADVARRLGRWQVRSGDIVLMRKGDVGRSAVVGAKQSGWILGSDCISVRVAHQDDLRPEYLRLALGTRAATRELLRRAPGTTMPGINERSLSPIPVPAVDAGVQKALLEDEEVFSTAAAAATKSAARLREVRFEALRSVWGGST